MKICTYILENMLFKIPAVGSTKIQTLPQKWMKFDKNMAKNGYFSGFLSTEKR